MLVDCIWDKFSEWTSCSKNCGGGKKIRTRSKKIEAAQGGKDCKGVDTESETCTHNQLYQSNCKGICTNQNRINVIFEQHHYHIRKL